MFIEHALRMLREVQQFFTEILKKRRLRRRVATIADRPLVATEVSRKHEGFQSIR